MKPAGCKSVSTRRAGSNPALPTKLKNMAVGEITFITGGQGRNNSIMRVERAIKARNE